MTLIGTARFYLGMNGLLRVYTRKLHLPFNATATVMVLKGVPITLTAAALAIIRPTGMFTRDFSAFCRACYKSYSIISDLLAGLSPSERE